MTFTLRSTCAAFVVAVACATPVEAFAQCTSVPAALVPRYGDAAEFRTAAQGIVDAFASGVSRVRGVALADAPSSEVRNTPQLISFLSNSNTIVIPWWEAQPAETRAVFRTFAGGGDAQAEHFFRAFFNRFLIAHEAAHWFQVRANRREATLYENEEAANRLAVAFWRNQPDGECFLAELERLAAQAVARLPDPTPAGESRAAYFGANYQTLGRDPLKYGYYQFRFMADALRDRAELDFARIVSGTAREAAIVVLGVSIVDAARGTVSPPQDILIEGGRIATITPAGTAPAPGGARRIDAAGLFAMPGLIDVHAHVGEGGIAPQDDTTRARALRQFLRYGVTTIFVPGATGAGDAAFAELRQRCRSGVSECPGLYGTGSILTAPGSHPVSTIFAMPDDVAAEIVEARGVTVLRAERDIEALVAAKAAAGVDAIKIIIEDGPPPWYPKPRLSDEQIARVIAAAHARSLPVYAHVSSARLTRVAVEAGIDGIMHGPIEPLPDDVISRMAERRTWYVPTLSLYDGILTWARKQREADPYALAGVEPSAIESLTAPPFLASAAEDEAGAREYVAHASENLRRAAAAGVPIALGTDVNNPFVFPGYSVHEELVWMVRAGLTPAQALRAGTAGAAAFLRASDRIGAVAPGFEADLVLLSGNPLERIENSRRVAAVIADGHVIAQVVTVR